MQLPPELGQKLVTNTPSHMNLSQWSHVQFLLFSQGPTVSFRLPERIT
jgi:hypothetical protein